MPRHEPPEKKFGDLFEAVQTNSVFEDSKQFVDATPKRPPDEILKAYHKNRSNADFDLRAFVLENFFLSQPPQSFDHAGDIPEIKKRLASLWDLLERCTPEANHESSLIPLPHPYLIPGGRFRELYYWDSYFVMLGLAAAGRVEMVRNMVGNFAYLIDSFGYVPNGNRTYLCSRSQPPVFGLMVELLAEVSGDDGVLSTYLPQIMREYGFWMRGLRSLPDTRESAERVVSFGDGYLNRYWDNLPAPRQESFREDVQLAASCDRPSESLYRDIRAACESGWDFSSRWFVGGSNLDAIRTTDIIPIDLNSLLCKHELILAKIYRMERSDRTADRFATLAERRVKLIQSHMFDDSAGFFVDLHRARAQPTRQLSLAGAFPLFLGLSTSDQANRVAATLREKFLKAGGWSTTLTNSGQQWDAPNGWAPLQWVVYKGLKNYGYEEDASIGAARWVKNNLASYHRTGNLFEKYDVERPDRTASGGEYENQIGFGWTNAVLLMLMDEIGYCDAEGTGQKA